MKLLLGLLAGLAWGVLAALLNHRISLAMIAKNTTPALLGANLLHTAVDIAALGTIFLLRKVLPFRYDAALVGTAIALSLLTIVLAYRMGKK